MRQASLECIYEAARRDERVVFVGSDLSPGGVFDAFREELPDRFFMEGIAEQNMVGLAAGLALDGYIPFVNTIGTFLTRRAYEQIVVDVCLHNVPVRLLAYGGGVVYAPLGPTHLAVEDIAILRCLPNMTIVVPCDADEVRRLIPCTLEWERPMYIRLARGGDPVISVPEAGFEIGKAITLREPGDVAILSTGVMTQRALEAADRLRDDGVAAGVLHFHTVKPLDVATIVEVAGNVPLLVTLEEHVAAGGFGSAVLETVADRVVSSLPHIRRLGLPDAFLDGYGSQEYLLAKYGLDANAVVAAVHESLAINPRPSVRPSGQAPRPALRSPQR